MKSNSFSKTSREHNSLPPLSPSARVKIDCSPIWPADSSPAARFLRGTRGRRASSAWGEPIPRQQGGVAAASHAGRGGSAGPPRQRGGAVVAGRADKEAVGGGGRAEGRSSGPGWQGRGRRSPPPALGGSLGRRGGTRQRGRRRTCTREQAVGGAWGKRTAEDGKRNRSSSFCSARGGYRKQDSQPSKIQSLLDPSFDKVSLFLANSSNIRELLEMLLNISN